MNENEEQDFCTFYINYFISEKKVQALKIRHTYEKQNSFSILPETT